MPGQKTHVHHVRIGEVVDFLQPWHRGRKSSRTDIQEDPVRFEHFAVYRDRPGAFEPPVTPVDRHIVGAFEPVLNAHGGGTDDVILARLDALHVDADRFLKGHTELRPSSSHVGRPGAGHQRLGRGAADVDAAGPLSVRPMMCMKLNPCGRWTVNRPTSITGMRATLASGTKAPSSSARPPRVHGSHDIGHQIRCRDADLREHADNEPVSLEVEQFRNPVKHEREAESDAHGYRCESVA